MSQLTAQFDPTNQEIALVGRMRPRLSSDLGKVLTVVKDSLIGCNGVVYLNVKRLTHINRTAFDALSDVLLSGCRERPDLKVVIVTSSVIAWSVKLFETLTTRAPNLDVQVYDSRSTPDKPSWKMKASFRSCERRRR